ncbi:MAG: biotin attachment protein [bacterium]|nr:biotin attachment protein [bacterium]MDD7751983.1 biotin attachment protein [bacterium]
MKKINFMLTAFRDGFQSVIGARVFSNDFLPVVEEAAAAGVQHFEAGGGALFQAAYFYSNEDAFTVMDNFRKAAGASANLQTLARGINVVGLDSQPRDIIRLHAQLMKKHGITTIRNFDALNDAENLIYSGKCIAEAGLHHEVTVTMMELPPGCQGHTVEFYESVLRRILNSDIPFHSIAFKDASGTSCPAKVYDTIKMARRLVGDKYPIAFHTHETAGCGVLCYKAALEGGADQIDLSIAPLSGGTCQPDVLTMWHALRGTEFSLDIDYRKIIRLEQSLKNALKDYFMPPEATKVDPIIPFCPMPGGALTANTQMLRDNGLMEKYHDIIEAIGETVSKGGFGTSVTPVSQFYFQQAFNNVMFGPWKKIAEGYGKMVLGYFGKTPGRPDPEVVRIASEQLHLEPTEKNPLDLNEANPAKGRKAAVAMLEANKLPITDENIFIAATCQEKGIAYLKGEGRIGVRKNVKNPETAPVSSGAGRSEVTVCINGKDYCVKFDKGGAVVNGVPVSYTVKENAAPVATPATAASAGKPEKFENLNAALPGIVLRMLVNPGDRVRADQAVMILESMKMETEVQSPVDGVLASFQVREGDQVQSGALLAVVKKV